MTYSTQDLARAGFGYVPQTPIQPQVQVLPIGSYNPYGYYYNNESFNYSQNFNYFPTNNIQIGLTPPASTPTSTPAPVTVSPSRINPTTTTPSTYIPILFTAPPTRCTVQPEIEIVIPNITIPDDNTNLENGNLGKFTKKILINSLI